MGFFIGVVWDGGSEARKSLCPKGGVETRRGGLYA